VLQRPGWAAFIALLDNYEFESGKAEKVTLAEKKEEEVFLTHCLKSPAMRYCHNYLVAKNLAPAEEGKFKDFLHDLWFGLYRRQVRPIKQNQYSFIDSLHTRHHNRSAHGATLRATSRFSSLFYNRSVIKEVPSPLFLAFLPHFFFPPFFLSPPP